MKVWKAMEGIDEDDLVKRSCAGDARAFRALLDHHYNTIFRIAFHLSGHKEDAEDITQMACLKISQNILTFRQDSKFTTWIYTIVLNTFRDWVSAKANKGHVPLENIAERASAASSPEQDTAVNEQIRHLRALPAPESEAVILVFGEGCSHKEAAEILGCAESTVSWRIHEARKKLSAYGGL